MSQIPSDARRPGPFRAMILVLVPVAVVLISAWPLILTQVHRGRMASDQFRYHEPTMRTFARDLPSPNYADYLSATTPGYHTTIAVVSRVLGDDRPTLQLLGSLFTGALIGLLAWDLTRGIRRGSTVPGLAALAVIAPVVFSPYVWSGAVWLLPDAAGWLGVTAMLVIALRREFGRSSIVAGGVILLLVVFMRQNHVWTAALVWLSAWLTISERAGMPTHEGQTHTGPRADLVYLVSNRRARLPSTALALAATMPAFALLGWFIVQWGGLTPPHFAEAGVGQVAHGGANLAAPAYVLALFGALSPFYFGFFAPALRSLATRHRLGVILVAFASLGVAIIPATTYSQADGRWSGVIWSMVQATPTIASHTSPVLAALSVVGGVSLLAWAISLPMRDRWILLAALVAFTAAQTANHQAWQRYVEPMALIWLALASVRVPAADSPILSRSRILAPMALACGFAAMCALIVVRGKPFPVKEYDRRVLPLIESGEDDAARAALDEIRRMFQEQDR